MLVKSSYLRIVLLCLIFAAGCAASSNNARKAPLDTDFQLRVGQTAVAAETELQLGFMAVTADSRCPKGEACFSAGDAVIRIWIQVSGHDRQEKDLHTARRGPNYVDYAGYRVHLVALHPTPLSGFITPSEQYAATLRVALKEPTK